MIGGGGRVKDEITKQFLQLLSSHLSGRRGCSKLEYEFVVDSVGNYTFSVNIAVYPDVNHRASSYQQDPVSHILRYHMPEVVTESNMLDMSKLVAGRYKYVFNTKRSRRKWIKEDSNN